MRKLKELLMESINLLEEINDVALIEEIENVRLKGSIFINMLNNLFPIILENNFEINPIIINKAEKLVEAIRVGDCISTSDILRFELKPILEEYVESIGELFEKK